MPAHDNVHGDYMGSAIVQTAVFWNNEIVHHDTLGYPNGVHDFAFDDVDKITAEYNRFTKVIRQHNLDAQTLE